MYRYIVSATARVGRCPICKENAELVNMTEEVEEYSPILRMRIWTRVGCRTFPSACRPCLEAQQHKNKIAV